MGKKTTIAEVEKPKLKERIILEERGIQNAKKGQVKKGAGRMPWHWEPKKDAISCDKLRGMANTW